jgi:hypothetical protein
MHDGESSAHVSSLATSKPQFHDSTSEIMNAQSVDLTASVKKAQKTELSESRMFGYLRCLVTAFDG